jgi:hypothetical protein
MREQLLPAASSAIHCSISKSSSLGVTEGKGPAFSYVTLSLQALVDYLTIGVQFGRNM